MKYRSAKIFLLGVTILSFSIPTSAQNAFNIGFHGGINSAKARHFNGGSTSERSGIILGGFVEIVPSNSWVSYQAEIHYIQKGAHLKDDTSGVHFKFNYLEIPLLFKSTTRFEGIRPFVFAGPKIGILLSSRAKIKSNGLTESRNLNKDTEPVDFSVDMGLGCEYTLRQSIWFIAARYSLGLLDIDRSKSGEWYSRDLQIVAGTKFSLN